MEEWLADWAYRELMREACERLREQNRRGQVQFRQRRSQPVVRKTFIRRNARMT